VPYPIQVNVWSEPAQDRPGFFRDRLAFASCRWIRETDGLRALTPACGLVQSELVPIRGMRAGNAIGVTGVLGSQGLSRTSAIHMY